MEISKEDIKKIIEYARNTESFKDEDIIANFDGVIPKEEVIAALELLTATNILQTHLK